MSQESSIQHGDNRTINSPREDIVCTAVKFLQNPSVAATPLVQRQKFLQTKGLTDQEISIAFERCNIYKPVNNQIIPNGLPPPVMQYVYPEQTLFMKIRDGLQSVAIISGILYAIYVLYRKFIEPLLFGNRKKKKSIEDHLKEINQSVTSSTREIQDSVARMNAQIDKIETQRYDSSSTERQLVDLKAEISSVKGLLLSRKQFPSPVMPPSIPAWQLSSAEAVQSAAEVDDRDKSEELIEIGSGSGSSETEVVTKNSDSSIEIISN